MAQSDQMWTHFGTWSNLNPLYPWHNFTSFYICCREVHGRKLSSESPSRQLSVIMKMDIEGSEIEVLTDLITSGALQVQLNLSDPSFDSAKFRETNIKWLLCMLSKSGTDNVKNLLKFENCHDFFFSFSKFRETSIRWHFCLLFKSVTDIVKTQLIFFQFVDYAFAEFHAKLYKPEEQR